MWGAVIGDIVGSRYEFARIKTKEFEFFSPDCSFTDDSVCTAAVAEILLDHLAIPGTLQNWCLRYPHPSGGYGQSFSIWMQQRSPKPYQSYGNGAAMRVSPAAFLNRNRPLDAALAASDRVTAVTHNHSEGMKGARATTHAIWLAFQGSAPNAIRLTISDRYEYDLSHSVDEIRPDYHFNESCQRTVPQAVTCALESASFEDAVRNAVSLGGDADTLAAIAGPIAEALHGIPEDLVTIARQRFLAQAQDIDATIDRMYGKT